MCKYLKGGCKEDEARLFSFLFSDRTKTIGPNLKYRKSTEFPPKQEKPFIIVNVVNAGTSLPERLLRFSEIFKPDPQFCVSC